MIKNQTVKDWIKEQGHSRSWLAAQCGVSKKTVDNWLSAGRPINASAATIINQLMIGRRSINPKIDLETFEAFRALDDDGKAAWLAYIVAMSLEAPSYRADQCPLQNRLATIMGVDVASWWRPTSENFFDRVSKGSILTLLAEVGGAALTARHATMKKTEISQSCAKLFAGEAIVEPEVRDTALAWVPNAMRFRDQVDVDDLDLEEGAGEQPDDAETVDAVEASETGLEPHADEQGALAA